MVTRPPRVSSLLIEESPLTFQPTLATILGLNEAIFLQQVQYWCKKSKHHHDGRIWIYNTIDQWKEQMPFWGTATIFRIVKGLRDRGVLLTTSKYNKSTTDRTLWYAIDHDALDALRTAHFADAQSPSYQSDEMEVSPARNAGYQSDAVIPETTQETTQGNTQRSSAAGGARAARLSPPPPMISEGYRNAMAATERQREKQRKERMR
jgi:hypothetical protein